MNLLASIVLYMEATFNYYLLSFYLKYFPGSIFENAGIFALSDFGAFIIAGVVLKLVSIPNAFRIALSIAFTGACFTFAHLTTRASCQCSFA
jgi:hypothetical protein